MSKRKLQDEGNQLDTPGRKTGTIPHANVTSSPPTVAYQYEEHEAFEGTSSRIEAGITVADDAERYNMGHPNRGTCLVFNHEVFEGNPPNRPGTKLDADRIKATFSKLGFDVVVYDDLEYDAVMDKIKIFSKLTNHANNDCLCVFVLTHGLKDDLLWANDVVYESTKIWKPFTADNCPTLAGKPKLFFFQACRGKNSDNGARVMAQSNDDNHMQIDATPDWYTIPTHADFLISHSCVDGFYSWRHATQGSCYVQSLCKVLDDSAGSTDLWKILTITARKVAIEFQFDDSKRQLIAQKQMPSVTSTLTKALYFTPK